MVTVQTLTNCSNTQHNIHTNARENITRTRAKRKTSYFFVAHPVYGLQYNMTCLYGGMTATNEKTNAQRYLVRSRHEAFHSG